MRSIGRRRDAAVISVIIPTFNEAPRLAALLADLSRETQPHEVIVADGGSRDGTAGVAGRGGADVVSASRGRGPQLAAGAARARGDILLFLHADSAFPPGGLKRIGDVMAGGPYVGGNFRLEFDGGGPFDRWLTGFYAWIRARGLYYGDSGVFVLRRVYDSLGGIRPIALMEDYDFNRRLERAGRTVCIVDPPLVTSSRKFDGRRAPAIVMGWLWLHALYHLGVSPDRLARIYYGRRGHV